MSRQFKVGRVVVPALVAVILAFGAPREMFSQGSTPAAGAAPAGGGLEILHVQNSVYAIFGAGGNITVQIGEQGPLLVDSGLAGTSDKIIAAVKTLTDKPIRDIVNTHVHPDHVGGNKVLSTSGGFVSGGTTGAGRRDATIFSHENVLLRMSGALGKEKPVDTGLWPGNTFFNERKEIYLNGEAVELLYQPAAHTDGDVIVFFRRSDVVSTGDIFVMDTFPMIDRARGGTINGLIAALNVILDIVVPAPTQERGTMIVPGHGRLADEHDLLEYRDMVTIIRDRIRQMIEQGVTLDQVRAARPTFEYEPRWGAQTGFWTTAMFVDAVYNSLKEDKGPLSRGERR
jgi:glyoxylase-like metal-dependent hydrolase (beta-lactamase superfamily II)